jgi:hypothetical protein
VLVLTSETVTVEPLRQEDTAIQSVRTSTAIPFFFRPDVRPLADFEHRLAELSRETSRDGWNDGRGKGTSPRDWERLHWISALVSFAQPELPEPLPGAESDGTVCARWSTATGKEMLLELKGPEVWLTYVDRLGTGETIRASQSEVPEAILRRLS